MNSTNYSLKGVQKGEYYVSFLSPGLNDYLPRGYYSHKGTVLDANFANSVVVDENISNVDLQIIKIKAIAGIIYLPYGSVAPEGGLLVSIRSNNIRFGGYTETRAIIPEGKNEVSYYLNVIDGEYRLSYDINPSIPYISKGYYSESGTVSDINKSSNLIIDNGVIDLNDNIDMIILQKPNNENGTDYKVVVDGIESSAILYEEGNKLWMQLRLIAETFGTKIGWDANIKMVTVSNGLKEIKIPIDSERGIIKKDRTYSDIVYLCEQFGYKLHWDFNSKVLFIETKDIWAVNIKPSNFLD